MSRSSFSYFAIFGAMRTGSNLLERNLNQYENLSCLGELFNPFFIGKSGQESFIGVSLEDRERDPMGLVHTIVSSNPGKLPGFRIFEGHDARVFNDALRDPSCAKIILKRTPLDSFLSLKIAQKTDQWILGNAPARKTAQVTYNGQEYRSYLSELVQYHRDLRHQLQIAGQSAFEIRYEDLKSVDVMNGLALYLGLDEKKSAFEEPIKRQNPEPASIPYEPEEAWTLAGTLGKPPFVHLDRPPSFLRIPRVHAADLPRKWLGLFADPKAPDRSFRSGPSYDRADVEQRGSRPRF